MVQLVEDVRVYQETIKHLHKLLSDACQERDEAKEQLQISVVEISDLKTLLNKVLSAVHQTPELLLGTGTCNNVSEYYAANPVDCASMVIENLVRGRPLPQKGQLLQAVIEAGPLLETLMITGPVPKWRNPPPDLLQMGQVPPGFEGDCCSISTLELMKQRLACSPSQYQVGSVSSHPLSSLGCDYYNLSNLGHVVVQNRYSS